ncbi:MAG: hypothetical protein SGARI_002143 [Bacillariaceae sp.]
MPDIHKYFDIAPEALVEEGDGKDPCVPIRAHCREEQQELEQNLEVANKVMDTSKEGQGFTCGVCLDDKQDSDNTTMETLELPCGHAFCYQCIKEVQYSGYEQGFVGPEQDNLIGLCPLCRKPMMFLDALVGSRVQALMALAETHTNNKEERDRVAGVALKNLDFVLNKEAGSMMPRRMQGEVYLLMEDYDKAIEAFKKAFNSFRLPLTGYVNPGLLTREQYEQRMEETRTINRTDPGTEFPSDEELEQTLVQLVQESTNALGSETLVTITTMLLFLAKAYLGQGQGQAMSALKLVLVLQKLNEPIAKQFDGCRQVDMTLNTTLAECYLHLGKVATAKQLQQKLVQKFRYRAGMHRLLVQCERKEGNLEKAFFYATKGYLYEEAWNEHVTRAKNLQLWNEIRGELQESSSTAAVADTTEAQEEWSD